uniref:Transcription factor n=1 Tax=Rhizophora mucronata TaxID=61149 RepID=A0A2P2P7K4_RHIMU
MSGVETVGNGNEDTTANELGATMPITLTEADLGEGNAEPVEAYTGRNSSGL